MNYAVSVVENNKTGGLNGIINEVVKLAVAHGPDIGRLATKLFNSIVQLKKFPSIWTMGDGGYS